MKGYCEICGTEIELQMCCSGIDCGCLGQPIEPPVCSDECYLLYMRKLNPNYNPDGYHHETGRNE